MKECGPLTRETKIPFFFGIGRTRAFLEEYGPAAKSHEIHLFILLFEQEEHEAFLKEYGPLMCEISRNIFIYLFIHLCIHLFFYLFI